MGTRLVSLHVSGNLETHPARKIASHRAKGHGNYFQAWQSRRAVSEKESTISRDNYSTVLILSIVVILHTQERYDYLQAAGVGKWTCGGFTFVFAPLTRCGIAKAPAFPDPLCTTFLLHPGHTHRLCQSPISSRCFVLGSLCPPLVGILKWSWLPPPTPILPFPHTSHPPTTVIVLSTESITSAI